MLATYRSILRLPGARRLVITALLARIPVGINALAIVLMVRRSTGSFVDAGIVDAGLALGSVIISPPQGRLVDRYGQPRVLIPAALISSTALVALVFGVHRHAALPVLAVLAAIGGGALPPMSASMRALWAFLISDADRRNTAFALESVLTEVYFIAGPLVTAVIVAVASPSAAVIASAILTVAGTTAFATSRPSRSWRATAGRRTLAGPLAGPGMRTLILSVVPMGLAFGTLEVAMPALATRHGDAPASGLLMGSLAFGSLLGGLFYGTRIWRRSIINRYLLLNALFAAGMAPLIVAGAIPVMIVLMAVAGLTLAPVTACAFALIEDVAPPGTTTEAFTWIFTANMTGAAAGAAISGAVIHSSGIRTALLLPPCGVALSFLIAFARRASLKPLVADGGVVGSGAVAHGGVVADGATSAAVVPGAAFSATAEDVPAPEADLAAPTGRPRVLAVSPQVSAVTPQASIVSARMASGSPHLPPVSARAASEVPQMPIGSNRVATVGPEARNTGLRAYPGWDFARLADGPARALGPAAFPAPPKEVARGRPMRLKFVVAALVLAAGLLGYRARDARADSHRRPRRR